jgi:pimeloyl-ACP methyl ester carboxylesterase
MTSQLAARRFSGAANVALRRACPDPDGTVVMLHGLGGDISQFAPILPGLRCPAYDVVRVDMRAHGATHLIGSPANFTFAQLALDVITLLERAAFPRPLIGVGISMGSGVLAAMELSRPRIFDRLFLVRPAWEDQPEPGNLRPFQEIALLLGTYGPAEGAMIFRSSHAFRHIRRQSSYAATSLLEQFSAPEAQARAVRLTRMPVSTPFCSLADLSAITIPATVVATPDDPLHPVPIAQNWTRNLRSAQFELIPAKNSHDQCYAHRLAQLLTRSLSPVG